MKIKTLLSSLLGRSDAAVLCAAVEHRHGMGKHKAKVAFKHHPGAKLPGITEYHLIPAESH